MSKRDKLLLVILILMSIAIIILFLHGFFGVWQRAYEVPPSPDPSVVESSQIDASVSPHTDIVRLIEQQAGMPLSNVARLIIDEEGVQSEPYQDATGYVTIGVGRSLQTNGVSTAELFAIVPEPDIRFIMENTTITRGRIKIESLAAANRIFPNPLTEHDLELLLLNDLKNVKMEAVSVFGKDWHKIDTVRQVAIIDIMFNLGLPHFKTFEKFINAVKAQDWKTAASELLLSEAARQNYSRYNRVSLVIDTGDKDYFK